MEKEVYITDEERKKCQNVADAFRELYELTDTIVVDAGRYGFVEMRFYSPKYGFDEFVTYTDSHSLFDGLWDEWLDLNLFLIAKEMKIEDVDYDDIFKRLPEEKQKEFVAKRQYFAELAGIETE